MDAVRRPVAKFIISTLVVLVAVTAASIVGVWMAAQAEARHDARDAANSFARLVVSPLRISDIEYYPHAETRRLLDQTVSGLLEDGEVYRVKIWRLDDDGAARIVYSDLRDLEGTRVTVSQDFREALATGQPVVIPVPDDDVHATEQRPDDHALEVYLAYEDSDGTTVVAELYLTVDTDARVREMLARTLPVAIGGPVLLTFLTLPLAFRLVRRQAAVEAERRELVEQALSASEGERGRLARLLHDGPIQDLAAIGITLERSAASSADVGDEVAEQVRAQVGRLRDLLDELEPVDLAESDLREALMATAGQAPGNGALVTVAGDDLQGVDGPTRTLIYRCASELLRNALTHADAETVTVRLSGGGEHVEVVVRDDGTGFDPSETPRGHHGLKLVRAALHDAGGTMDVVSGSDGTEVAFRLPM